MLVMSKRKCGTPRAGLYAVGTISEIGTLNAFTAIAAPVEAEIQNPRAAEKTHLRSSLFGGYGLISPGPGLNDEPFAQLPIVGMADLWGMGAGYKTVWDAIEETLAIGIARRIPAVPEVSLPCPVLMMHMRAVAELAQLSAMLDLSALLELLDLHGDSVPYVDALFEQPWRDADSIGRVGDDTFMGHPLVALWKTFGQMPKPAMRKKAMHDVGLRLRQGIFGLSWITAWVEVLKPDQERVSAKNAERGVLPAYAPDDPRAKGADNE